MLNNYLKMFISVACDLCSRSFKNRASLRTHKTNFHRNKDTLKDNMLSKTSERTGPPTRLGLKVQLTNAQLVDNFLDKKRGELSPEVWKKYKRQTQSEIRREKASGKIPPSQPLQPFSKLMKAPTELEPSNNPTPKDPDTLLTKRKRVDSDTDESSDAPVLRKAMKQKKTKYRKKRSRRQKAIESANDTDISWDKHGDGETDYDDGTSAENVTDTTADTDGTTDTNSVKSDETVVNNDIFYGDDGTALPVDIDTDDTLSNDGAIVPYETKTDTDDTLSNEDDIVPYQPLEDTDDTLSNGDTVDLFKSNSSDDEILQPFVEKAVLTGTNKTSADGSLVPFVKPVLITNNPPPRTIRTKYRCNFCFDIFKSQNVLHMHVKRIHPYRCNQCMRTFDTEEELIDHLEVDHPTCKVCGDQFPNREKYLHHYHTDHPQEEANEPDPDTDMDTESEDELTDEENPNAELKREDKQFHKHINCITIDRFLDIKRLISANHFESLVENKELMEGLQILLKGVVKGFVPICSSQRFALTKQMKDLMYSFVKYPSARKILRDKTNFKLLFDVIWSSVESVITSFLKYPI